LKRHVIYKLPPRPSEISSINEIGSEEDLLSILQQREVLELWRFLLEIGVGPPYIDEVLLRSGLKANLKVRDLSQDQKYSLASAIVWLARMLKSKPDPVIYLSEGEMVNFSVFPLSSLKVKYETKPIVSFLDLLEEYFSPIITRSVKDKALLELEKRARALETELRHQKDLLKRYEEELSELRQKGELLFSNLYEVQDLIEMARKGIQDERIIYIDRSKHLATIVIGGVPISIDFMKTASENASNYYVRAKKLRLKLVRGKEMLKILEKRLLDMRSHVEILHISKEPKIRKRKKWFERFRWFLSTEGFLVLAGRDKSTNRELVRRYMEDDDLFFHIEQPGGAVVLVKTEGKVVGDETLSQAADYAASFSRAWKEGLSYADVYYVKGKQVLTHAPPKMYIPKGSFYIRGKRTYLRGKLELAIGIWELDGEPRVISCPIEASVAMKTKVHVIPGEMDKLEAAKMIKEALENELKKVTSMSLYLDLDEIMKALPSGRFRILRR